MRSALARISSASSLRAGSISKKPAETRQGTGKGDVEFWAAVIKPGTVLYELDGVTEEVAKKAFNRVAHKLPIKVRMIRRRHG